MNSPSRQVKERLAVLAPGIQERLRVGRPCQSSDRKYDCITGSWRAAQSFEDHLLFENFMVGQSQSDLRVVIQPFLDAEAARVAGVAQLLEGVDEIARNPRRDDVINHGQNAAGRAATRIDSCRKASMSGK